jgi:hypothetical protein
VLETLILVAVIAPVVWLARTRCHLVAGVWREARWWERCLLIAALLPIPGPVDELAGLMVARRVAVRHLRP